MYTDLKHIICSAQAPKHSPHLTSGTFPTASAGAGKGIKVTPPKSLLMGSQRPSLYNTSGQNFNTEKTKDCKKYNSEKETCNSPPAAALLERE